MINQTFYQTIAEEIKERKVFQATVLDGEKKGAKLLASGDEILWTNMQKEWLFPYFEELKVLKGNGVREVQGQLFYHEWIGSRKRLIVCGAGHVGIALMKLAKFLGFYVIVLEDREEFAALAKEAKADEILCADMGESLRNLPEMQGSYYVVVTRGHAYDRMCIEEILKKSYAYVGMMGSKGRVKRLLEEIKKDMVHGAQSLPLEDVHTPVGLDIGAQTPEEIAVSIMAQVIREKNQHQGLVEFAAEVLEPVAGHASPLNGVMATIIERKGSAPREVGTKIVVLDGWKVYGTIGGGILEAQVLDAIGKMMKENKTFRIMEVDLSAKEAAKEGSICGGKVKVMLERIYE